MGGYQNLHKLLDLAEKAQPAGRQIEWDNDLDNFFESDELNRFIKKCDPFTIAWLCRFAIKNEINVGD